MRLGVRLGVGLGVRLLVRLGARDCAGKQSAFYAGRPGSVVSMSWDLATILPV